MGQGILQLSRFGPWLRTKYCMCCISGCRVSGCKWVLHGAVLHVRVPLLLVFTVLRTHRAFPAPTCTLGRPRAGALAISGTRSGGTACRAGALKKQGCRKPGRNQGRERERAGHGHRDVDGDRGAWQVTPVISQTSHRLAMARPNLVMAVARRYCRRQGHAHHVRCGQSTSPPPPDSTRPGRSPRLANFGPDRFGCAVPSPAATWLLVRHSSGVVVDV